MRERIAALYLRDYAGSGHLDLNKVVDDFLSLRRFQEQRESLEAAAGGLTGKLLLEVGAGFGTFLAYARREGVRAVGVEIDEPMVALARDLARGNGVTGCPLVVGAGETLPFRSGTFDVAFSNSVLEHVRDPGQVLRETIRVLRPGGRLLVLEFSKPVLPLLAPAYDAWSFKVLPVLGRLVADDEASYRYLAESIRRFPDQDTLKAMMEQAGLGRVHYHNLSGGIVALHKGYRL